MLNDRPACPVDSQYFQHGYGYDLAIEVMSWSWSEYFGRWSAYVLFYNGDKVHTYPAMDCDAGKGTWERSHA